VSNDVSKFFELLANDKNLVEKLSDNDKAYAEIHKNDKVDKLKAAEEIILPVAKEAGFHFTLKDLMDYENEKADVMEEEFSDEELSQVAGGQRTLEGYGAAACYWIGLGFAASKPYRGEGNFCAIFGLGMTNACWSEGTEVG